LVAASAVWPFDTGIAALVGLCILTWIKEADCDPVVEIMSRVPNEGAVFRAV
jgi:hypothetical protein